MPAEPLEIAALEREIAIVGHAQRHRDVGRLVTLDLVARTDVDRDRGGERDDEQDGSGERCGAMGRETRRATADSLGHRRHARHHSENPVIWSSGHLVFGSVVISSSR